MTEKPRFSIIVDEELFKKIEDFRFKNRFQSRSTATVELIRLGFKQLEETKMSKNELEARI